MSKFQAQISVALNPESVSGLAKSIQEALKSQTISLDGIKLTAKNIDVSGIVNTVKKQVQDGLKDIGVNMKVGGNVSIGASASGGARTSSRTSRNSVAGTKSVTTKREHASPTEVDVGAVTSKKINVVKSADRKAAEKALNEKNLALNQVKTSNEIIAANRKLLEQEGLTKQQIKDFNDAIKAAEKSVAEGERKIAELDKQHADIQQKIIAQREKNARVLEKKSAKQYVDNARNSVRVLQDQLDDYERQKSEINKQLALETNEQKRQTLIDKSSLLSRDIHKTNKTLSEIKESAANKKKEYNIRGKQEDNQLFAATPSTSERSSSGETTSDLKRRLTEGARQAAQAAKAQDLYNQKFEELDNKRQRFVDNYDLKSYKIKQLQKKLYSLDKSSDTYAQEAKDTRALIKETEALKNKDLGKISDLRRQINQLKIQKKSGVFEAAAAETTSATTTAKRTLPQKGTTNAQKLSGHSLTKQQKTADEQQKASVQQTQATEKQTQATTSQTQAINNLVQATEKQQQAEKKAEQKSGTKAGAGGSKSSGETKQSGSSGSNPPSGSDKDYQKKAADYLTRIYNAQNKNSKYLDTEDIKELNKIVPQLEAIKNDKKGKLGWISSDQEKELRRNLSKTKSGTAKLRLKNITDTQYANLEQDINRLINSEYYKKHKKDVNKAISKFSREMSPQDYQTLNGEIAHYNAEAERLNQTGKSFLSRLKDQYDTFLKYTVVAEAFMKIRQAMQDMVTAVKEVDAAMTELRKVTSLSESGYEMALERAKTTATEVGASVSDTVNATADFARLGYNVDDAAELAKVALIYKNVGDGIENISQASESIISTMQAFGIEAKDAMSIVDKFNEVGKIIAERYGNISKESSYIGQKPEVVETEQRFSVCKKKEILK